MSSESCPTCGRGPESLCQCPVCSATFATRATMVLSLRRDENVQIPEAVREEYELGRVLGHGAMGLVIFARDKTTGLPYAIKFLRKIATDELLERFQREARTLRQLSHPHVVAVKDAQALDSMPYIVCEYLEGGSLRSRMNGESRPIRETLLILADVLAGLAHCHSRGVVHRDLKPENILFTGDGRAKVADFGISKHDEDLGRSLTATGALVGTPLYMSPEQVRGERAGPASDIYSAGVVLYELLAGRPPFALSNLAEVLTMHLEGEVPPLPDARPPVPPRVAELVKRTLAKAPGDRPASAAALADGLRAAAAHAGLAPEPKPRRARSGPLSRTGGMAPSAETAPAAPTVPEPTLLGASHRTWNLAALGFSAACLALMAWFGSMVGILGLITFAAFVDAAAIAANYRSDRTFVHVMLAIQLIAMSVVLGGARHTWHRSLVSQSAVEAVLADYKKAPDGPRSSGGIPARDVLRSAQALQTQMEALLVSWDEPLARFEMCWISGLLLVCALAHAVRPGGGRPAALAWRVLPLGAVLLVVPVSWSVSQRLDRGVEPAAADVARELPLRELARFEFDGAAKDSGGAGLSFEPLVNVDFEGTALRLNGLYVHENPAGYQATVKVPRIDETRFAIGLRFKSAGFDRKKRSLVTAGICARWFQVGRSESGKLKVVLNNNEITREFESLELVPDRWTALVCGFDQQRHVIAASLDGGPMRELRVQAALKATSSTCGDDKVISFTNYSDGTTFHGLVDELVIYSRLPTAEELPKLSMVTAGK